MRKEFRQRLNRATDELSTWDSPVMGELSETSAALVSTLHRMRADLAARGDVAGVETVLKLMMATVAADEVMSALGRGDSEGVEFHTDVLQRSLESAGPIRFEALG